MESIVGLRESEGMSPKSTDESELLPSKMCDMDKYDDSSPKSNGSLCELFTRFEAFNFDDDVQFQSGLSKISSLRNTSKTENHAKDLLKIKAFYYSKNIEPFDFAAYMEWSQKQTAEPEKRTSPQDSQAFPVDDKSHQSARSQQADGAGSQSHLSDKQQTLNRKPESSLQGPEEQPDSSWGSDISVVLNVEDVHSSGGSKPDSECSPELSFAEIAELIQSGKPIPGLAQIEVVPTNEAPTPSQLPRAKKPWEE